MTASHHGLTLIECLATLAIISLMASLGAPPLQRQLQAAAVGTSVNLFLTDLRFARSEAVHRQRAVVMCRSSNPEAPQPTCAGNADPSPAGWASGWIIFVDNDRDGQLDAAEEVLRVQTATRLVGSISANNKGFPFRFNASGRLQNLASAATVRFGDEMRLASAHRRVICVGIGGRARVAGDGNTSCGATT